ncbi:propionyl-CoA synthetase [Halovulum dunhuangense]|uniref:Propionyl-CoA synthetase n=1 Tax=Halovulum dunhuangense TaxID=1505036 RepID=A0A849L4P9_9RHOB|nr:propionyl-CoA synthetase [Halovulum dunhuangense]NNU81319.1 propionyl-CoA synthetase [Halovulum dunhuangense]
MGYAETYAAWQADPEGWWTEAARALDWDRFPTRALDDANPPIYRWFADGEMNTCHNALDRHVAAGRGDQAAIIHDSPVTGTKRTLTYAEMRDATARLAGALRARGVEKGDSVIIYMPMVPEAVIAMLACARIGAVHSVVFGGFAAHELAVRIDDAQPRAIIAGSCGIEPGRVVEYKPLLDSAIEQSVHDPDFCVILQRPEHAARLGPRDVEWEEFQKDVTPADCVPVGGADPLYILYTSGTTGQPKGVVRPNAGHAVALHWTMKNIYGIDPGEVFWAASDVGWVVGHSYICYAPLLVGATSILFEGKPVGTPDAGTYWRVIAEHGVRSLFTAPTAFRAIKRVDPEGAFIGKYDISCLRTLYLAGERADPDTVIWAQNRLKVPVVDHWWQTETGWPIVANPLGLEPLPIKVGSPSVPMPGWDVRVLDEAGHELPRGTLGAIAVKLPLPPGTLSGLWNAEERFRKAYLTTFPGYYETGDAGLIDEEGYVYIMARTDDVINVAGHRLSTGAMEEVLADLPEVAECAVIGVKDDLKGQLPMGFLCLTAGVNKPHEQVVKDAVARVRDQIGPVAAFKLAVVVDRLPKTRSGKILRATMARIADGEAFKIPATIDDPAILDEIREAIRPLGYGG